MAFQFTDKTYTLTAALGTISQTVTGFKNERLDKINVIPASDNTQYTIEIVDRNSKVAFRETEITGVFNYKIDEPIYGNYTFKIMNSTVDEAFSVVLVHFDHYT